MHLVFTDIVMPGGMTGYDVAERVRSMKPDLKVLLTSGYRWPEPKSMKELKAPKSTLRRFATAVQATAH